MPFGKCDIGKLLDFYPTWNGLRSDFGLRAGDLPLFSRPDFGGDVFTFASDGNVVVLGFEKLFIVSDCFADDLLDEVIIVNVVFVVRLDFDLNGIVLVVDGELARRCLDECHIAFLWLKRESSKYQCTCK